MCFIDRIFRRKIKLSVSYERVRQTPGPLSVHEAWELAKPLVFAADRNAKLLMITSDTDIQQDGRSFSWYFLLALESKAARLSLTFCPEPGVSDIDRAPIYLERKVITSVEPLRQVLPMKFRDSIDVVDEFAAAGVDFVAGPTDMKLETGFSVTGKPVWVTYYWGQRLETEFQLHSD